MTNKTKELALMKLIEIAPITLAKRLSYLVDCDVIDNLSRNHLLYDMTNSPKFTNICELRSFVNDCGYELTRAGVKCAEANGNLTKCTISFDVESQYVNVRYEYNWQEEGETKRDYDTTSISVEKLIDEAGDRLKFKYGFEFKVC